MFYIKDGIKCEVEIKDGEIEYPMGKIEYRTSIGLIITNYVDLRFTTIDEGGRRHFQKDFRNCVVEEVTIKKKVMTDEEGDYFESNDLYLTAGGVSLGPVFIPDKYKIRLQEDTKNENV